MTTPIDVRREGAIGHLVLNRPQALNAITVELGRALHDALVELADDPAINVIAVRGAGGNFCAGGDFQEVDRLRAAGAEALAPLFENFGQACEAIARLAVPVVAVVEGNAMAGGFELMLAADIALVHEQAKIADNHSNFGQIPGGGSSQRLPRVVGHQRALGLILSGERISGHQAVEWGLAYRCYPPETFEADVAAFVSSLATKNRTAAAATKRLVYDGCAMPLADGLALERQAVIEFVTSDDGAAGVKKFGSRKA